MSLFRVLTIAILLGGTALAQKGGDNSTYFVTYFSNSPQGAGVPDQTVRIINDGDTGANLWASYYVFDDSQEMQECCSCEVTPDGLNSESVEHNLTNNTLTSRPVSRGVIKIIGSSVAAGGPNFTNTLAAGLRGWATHVQSPQNKSPYGAGPFSQTETGLRDSNLSPSQETLLETLCLYVNLLGGGGQGVCTCTPEDVDF
ncbi:MAG: hypothetical protein WBV31_10820 [Terriglobales bacterium]